MANTYTSPVTTVIKAIPNSVAVQFVFEPFYELYQCFQDATTKKHLQIRNIVQGFIVLLALITGGIILPFSSQVYFDFVTRLAPILNATDSANNFFSYYFSAWFIAYPVSWISRSFINIYSLCQYSDLEFYLTKERKKTLFEALDEPDNEIEEIFLYIRSELRSGKSIPGARQEDLIEALLTFMDGAPSEVIRVYQNYKKFYMIYLCESGQTKSILEPENIIHIAEKYGVSADEITEVLEHCILGIRADSATLGNQKQYYIQIIQNILEANPLGFKLFRAQHYYIENIKLVQELTDLIYLRKTQIRTESGSFASMPGDIDLEEGDRARELEVWALEFAQQNWQSIAHNDNVPTSLSTKVLEQLVAYLLEVSKPENLMYQGMLSSTPIQALTPASPSMMDKTLMANYLQKSEEAKNTAMLFQARALPEPTLKKGAEAEKSAETITEEETKRTNSPKKSRSKSTVKG